MASEFDFNFRVNQTVVEIIEGDIIQVVADVIVSSDDVYLSMGGGVSYAISRVAGESLREDVRKQSLPLTLGSVAVTTAGRLQAKYVFHATTLGVGAGPPANVLVATLIRRILELGATLQVDHIALPLLGAGTAALSAKDVLRYIFQSAMYFLATERFPLRKLTIVLLPPTSSLRSTIEELHQVASPTVYIQHKLDKLQALREEIPDDKELAELLGARIADARKELSTIFYFKELDTTANLQISAPVSYEEGQPARERLQEALTKLQKELDDKKKLQEFEVQRLDELEKRQARASTSIPHEVEFDINTLRERIKERAQEIAGIDRQQKRYQKELGKLQANYLDFLVNLLQILTERFNDMELRTFCFYLDIDYEVLSGSEKTGKAMELVEYFKRRDRMAELVETGKRTRPDIDWPKIPSHLV